jgi:hypothetical protein
VADIFQEVDEEVRKDKATELWNKYGNYVIAAAVLIVVATAAWVFWKDYRAEQRQEHGARFAAALELASQDKPAEAATAFRQLAENAGGGVATLAKLQEAAQRIADGDRVGAVGVYDSIAADSGAEDLYRQLATVLSALHQLDTAGVSEIEGKLRPLIDTFGPFTHFAKELLAYAKLKAGDSGGAKELFISLSDDATAPPGIRGRATEMVTALGAS